MQIRILGCSGGIGSGLRTTCLRVDDDILIDAGTGLGDMSLGEMAKIRHIFLTHSHLDHITGIPLMVDSMFDRLQGRPVVVHGLPQTLDVLREHIFNWKVWPDFTCLPTAESPVLVLRTMQPGETVEVDGRCLEMVPVQHVVPGVGYRLEDAGGSFAFSGDTSTNDSFWSVLNSYPTLDALMVECAFANQELELSKIAGHYCPSLLAADLAKLRHRPRIYLTHLKPGAEKQIVAECKDLLPDHELVQLAGNDLIPV